MRTWLVLLLVGLGPVAALAQQPTTVQLPTYSVFGVGTSVSVPDGGATYLGGVNRASTGMNEFGTPLTPLRNRSFGMERSASNMSVHVTIHDFEAMEEALLGQAPSSVAGSQPRSSGTAQHRLIPRPWAAGRAVASVAEAQAERAREQLSPTEEAMSFFERGRAAEEAGKANVAKIYYQMAARRATGGLKDQAVARLDAINKAKQPPRLAQGTP